MFSTIKTLGVTLTVGFLLAIAFAATAQAGNGVRTRDGLTPQQWKAVRARAEAMDRYYQLGRFSPGAEARQVEKRYWQAVDDYYRFGTNTAVRVSNPFDWADAGIGAGSTLGVILLASGLTVAFRRRTVREASFPRTT